MKDYKFQPKGSGDNKLLVTGGIVFLVVVIAVAFMYFNNKDFDKKNLNFDKNITGQKNLSQICDDACYMALGTNGYDFESCKKISDDGKRQTCFEFIGNKSIDACLSVVDNSKRENCIFNYALVNKNIDACQKIETSLPKQICSSTVDKCYYKTGYEKTICMALDRGDYRFCNGNETCLLDYAYGSKDASGCGILDTEAKIAACNSLSKEKNSCADLGYKTKIGLCNSIYAIWTNQSSYCNNIDPETSYAVDCYSHFAVLDKNKNYCANLAFNSEWTCYSRYSWETGDLTGCMFIEDLASFSKTSCFVNYARDMRDPSACTYLNDTYSKVNCYVASITANLTKPIPETNCLNIDQSSWKSKCYTYSAIQNNDSGICAGVPSDTEKANCYSKFKK